MQHDNSGKNFLQPWFFALLRLHMYSYEKGCNKCTQNNIYTLADINLNDYIQRFYMLNFCFLELQLHYGDLTDSTNLVKIISEVGNYLGLEQ